MTPNNNNTQKMDDIISQVKDARKQRENTYRERALKLFPWVCARCGREFSGKKLRELTVHHKDHNHDFNPPDGSNWELLCLYCHENEHSRYLEESAHGSTPMHEDNLDPSPGHRPFANLDKLLKRNKPD